MENKNGAHEDAHPARMVRSILALLLVMGFFALLAYTAAVS